MVPAEDLPSSHGRKDMRPKNNGLGPRRKQVGVCVLGPELHILELDDTMRRWFPEVDLEQKPLCYRVFHSPPGKKACPHCPSVKTMRDGKVHRATLTLVNGNGDMHIRATSMPLRNAHGQVIGSIEKLERMVTGERSSQAPRAVSRNQNRRILKRSKALPSRLERENRQETGKLRTLLERRKRWGLSFQYITGETNRKLRALLETTHAVTSSLDREKILQVIGDKAKELLQADGCTIYLLDATAMKLKPLFSNETNVADQVLAFELQVGEGLSGKVAESGVARIVNHAEKDEEICVQIPGTPEVPECLISAPLITKQRVVGVMTLNRDGGKVFHKKDLELLTLFANQVSGIVENAQLYDRLKESEERYRGIFENCMDILYITEADGNILEINPAGLRNLGLTRENAIGQHLDSLFVSPKGRGLLNRKTRRAGFVKNLESQMKTAEGQILDVLETRSALKSPEGTVVGFMGIIRDITERKKLQEELIQSQKLEAIGRLAGGVAHDFNNLLSGILGYASYAKSLVSPDSKLWRTLDIIQKSSEKAAELTRQLLGFSRKARYRIETVDINELIIEVLKLIESTIANNVVVEKRLDSHLPGIDVDATQIQQVILNLCLNANDAMTPTGGHLTLETKTVLLREGDSHQSPVNLSLGRYLQIAISDTGVGMDDVTRRRIFEPFFTTKDEGKGTGLGLALAYGIIKSHGGDIACRSIPGQGSSFEIFLPICREAAPLPKRRKRSQHTALPRGQETILIVDDEEVVRHLTKDVLRSLGYGVILAASGAEAIRLYSSSSDQIALVLVDMVMHPLGCEEILTKLKEIDPDLKVVLTTGHSHEDKALAVLKEGVDHFIQKPYTMASLAQVIRETLDG